MAEITNTPSAWKGLDYYSTKKDTAQSIPQQDTIVNNTSSGWRGLDSYSKKEIDTSPYGIDTHGTMSKNDLKESRYADKIRRYMIHMKGIEYKNPAKINNDQLIEDFYDHMRWFNSNTFSTALEAKRVYNSNDAQKKIIADAYDLYDSTGNLFGAGSDDLGDIFDGLKDYFLASASDPSNYIGLLTGGIAKGMTSAGSVAGKELIKKSISQAEKKLLTKRGKKSLAAAEKKAWKNANEILKQNGINKNAPDGGKTLRSRLAQEAAERESKIFKEELANKTIAANKAKLDKKYGKTALQATFGIDAAIGMFHDYKIQSLYSEVDPSYKHSWLQTGAAGAFGLVPLGAQLGVRALKSTKAGKSGLQDYKGKSDIAFKRVKSLELLKMAVDTPTAQAISKEILSEAKTWRKSIRIADKKDGWFSHLKGEQELDFLGKMMLGNKYKNPDPDAVIGGVVGVLLKAKVPARMPDGTLKRDANGKVIKEPLKLSMHTTITDLMATISKSIDPNTLAKINKELQGTGLSLSEFGTDMPTGSLSLGNLVKGVVGRAGAEMNLMSQTRKILDPIITFSEHINGRIAALDGLEARYTNQGTKLSKATGGKWAAYGHNFWRRMLVSAPSTTAVNVAGFGQFAIARTASDILTSSALYGKGLMQAAAGEDAAARETFRVAKVLKDIQAQKFRNFLDPYTTRETYLAILKQNPDLERILKATTSMGIETKAKKFNVDPENPVYQTAEAIANGSHAITGVRAQDTFTKSQMFITEMDKHLRIHKGKTLSEVINSTDPQDMMLVDQDILSKSLDTTLKSVFSDDYTKVRRGDISELPLGGKVEDATALIANIVEGTSNIPVIGTLLPFGKFMNNLIAFSYQWTAGGAVDAMAAVAARQKPKRIKAFNNMTIGQQSAENIKPIEAAARSAIGLTALGYMAHQDKESYEKGLPWYHIDVGGGTEVDIKNVFPFSLWKVLARIINHAYLGTDGIDALQSKDKLRPKTDEREGIGYIPPALIADLGQQLAIGQVAKDVQFGNDITNLMSHMFGQNDDKKVHRKLDTLMQATGNIVAGTTRPLDMFNDMAGYVFNSDVAKDPRQNHGLSRFSIHATKYVDNIIEMFTDNIDSITGTQLEVATRTDVTQDPSALASMLGVKIVQNQSGTERAYALAEVPTWKGNKRSGAPDYDRLFNKTLAPKLDKFFSDVANIQSFDKLNAAQRKAHLTNTLKRFKAEVTSELALMSPAIDLEGSVATIRYQILNMNKEDKYSAKAMLEREARAKGKPITHDFNLSIMTLSELQEYRDKIKHNRDTRPYLGGKGLSGEDG